LLLQQPQSRDTQDTNTQEADEEEGVEEADTQSTASTGKDKEQTPSTSKGTGKERSSKRKKDKEDEQTVSVVQEYFSSRLQQATAGGPVGEDKAFCEMLNVETSKIKSGSVKKVLKRKMLDMVLAAQEEQDDQESQESHSIPLQYVILQPQAQQQVSGMADVQLLQHFAEGVPLLQQQGTDLQQPSPAE